MTPDPDRIVIDGNPHRRRFLRGLTVAPLAALAAPAWGAARKTIAMLWGTADGPGVDPDVAAKMFAGRGTKDEEARAFAVALEPFGYRLGVDLEVQWFDYPHFGNWDEVVPRAVSRMVAAKPDCIVVGGTVFTRYVARATRTIPIVTEVADPVASGFAQSIARPGGNVTGLATKVGVDLKTLELLARIVPGLSCVGWITYREQAAHFPSFGNAARDLRLDVRQILLDEPRPDGWQARLAAEFEQLRAAGCAGAWMSAHEPFFSEALELALRHRIAVANLGGAKDEERDGVLLVYQAADDPQAATRRGAAIIAKVLKGERPATIPFEGPRRYRLAINLRTARRLGVTIPPQVLVLADKRIE